MKPFVFVLLVSGLCGCAHSLTDSTIVALPVEFAVRDQAAKSPYPFDSYRAQAFSISHIRRLNGDRFPWHEKAKYFPLPAGQKFNAAFRAYGWHDADLGPGGFFVTDVAGNIVMDDSHLKPSYFEALDLEADGDMDLLLFFRNYGNAAGSDDWVVYLNDANRFVRAGEICEHAEIRGQPSRTGTVLWLSDRSACAIFEGEELEVSQPEWRVLDVGKAYRAMEAYCIEGKRVKLKKRVRKEIPKIESRYLTYR